MSKKTLLAFILLVFLTAAASLSFAQGDPVKGKASYGRRGCSSCHSIERIGGAVGPDLTQATLRRTEEWLLSWLRDPPSLLKGTDMPKVPWTTDDEIYDVIAFLKTFRKEADRGFLGKVPRKEAGRLLVEGFDCKSCHRIKDPGSGRARFPDLSKEGRKRKKPWLRKWLFDPQAVKPGTFMPTFRMTDEEREAVVEYLSTLK